MPGKLDKHTVSWAEGKGNNLARSTNRTGSWGMFKQGLGKPFITPELRKSFEALPKDEQHVLKSVNGWVSGAQTRNNRRNKANLLPRDLVTLDIDYAPVYFLDLIREGLTGLCQYEAYWHSSRRHTLEAPRVRLFMPLLRKVTIDEYTALSRYCGWLLDNTMGLVDLVSYWPAQMMFRPTCSSDDAAIFFRHEQYGHLLDPDGMLKAISKQFGDWTDLGCLPRSPEEGNLRQKADKAEDPRSKNGPVGVFCRTYDIYSAMAEFLPGKYIPGDEHSSHPRYTYVGSTTSNGAIVYDDGLFLFSHHGHDPVNDLLVNAFDLVRIHLYGDLDKRAQEGTTSGRMPSYKALLGRLKVDKKYQRKRIEEHFAGILNAFTDEGVAEGEETDGSN